MPKANGPDFWTRVQLMAVGEKLQGCLDLGKVYPFLDFFLGISNTAEVRNENGQKRKLVQQESPEADTDWMSNSISWKQ